ncbi:MAG TPA: AraC family transcriptional regulator [Polyangiaceae bacterium]|jgi:AraC-like DNA-binding protein|nr:AraC family transcriptional regulator [Polyangiaceae bacterium]
MAESIQVHQLGHNGSFALDVAESERMWRYFHEGYCITLVQQGLAYWRYRNRDAEASPRGLMLMEPGEVHANTKIVTPGTFFGVFIPQERMQRIAQELGLKAAHFKTEFLMDPAAIAQMTRLRDATLLDTKEAQDEQLDLALISVLTQACESAITPASVYPSNLRRGKEALFERYSSEPWHTVDVEQIAQEVGLSYYWFVHAFSQHFGVAPYQYVKTLRMARARELMSKGPSDAIGTVGEIATASGYADASHMNREFKQSCGVRPGALAMALHPAWRTRSRRV